MTKNLLFKIAVAVCAVWLGGRISAFAQQQGYVVTGEVFTNTSDPIVGVTVVEKGAAGGRRHHGFQRPFLLESLEPPRRRSPSLMWV